MRWVQILNNESVAFCFLSPKPTYVATNQAPYPLPPTHPSPPYTKYNNDVVEHQLLRISQLVGKDELLAFFTRLNVS